MDVTANFRPTRNYGQKRGTPTQDTKMEEACPMHEHSPSMLMAANGKKDKTPGPSCKKTTGMDSSKKTHLQNPYVRGM